MSEGRIGTWSKIFKSQAAHVLDDTVPSSASQFQLKLSTLEKMQPLLSRPNFSYISPKEEKSVILIILKLWEWLLYWVDTVPYTRKSLFYRSLSYIMQRREFSLDRFFSTKGIISENEKSIMEQQVIVEYRKNLLLSFKHVLKLINADIKNPLQLLFTAQVYAVSFFRLPSVGIAILDAVFSSEKETFMWKDEMEESGKSKMQSSLEILGKRVASSYEADSTDADFISKNPSIFQWSFFFDELDLAENLWTDLKWTDVLKERGDFFFTFLRLYSEHVEFTIIKRPIAWHLVPGYNLFLSAFMKQMCKLFYDIRMIGGLIKKEQDGTAPWTESLKSSLLDCSVSLLENQQLINLYVTLAFDTCNSYSCEAVEFCLRCIELWFDSFRTSSASVIYNPFDKNITTEVVEVNANLEPHALSASMMVLTADGGLDIGVRVLNNESYRQCFTGKETVKWVLDNGLCKSVDEAERACSRLLFSGLIKPVGHHEDFSNSNLLFRFTAHERSGFRFMERGEFSLPPTFDINYFVKGFKILLDSEHFQILLRSLSFLYNQLDLIHGNARLVLVLELFLKRNFFKLFLHWCYMVRKFFHHILVYKLFRTSWNHLPCSHSMELLRNLKISNSSALLISPPVSLVKKHTSSEMRLVVKESEKPSISDRVSSWIFGGKKEEEKGRNTPGERLSLPRVTSRTSVDEEGSRKRSTTIFAESLENEQQALDLVLASKLDSFIMTLTNPKESDEGEMSDNFDFGNNNIWLNYKSIALKEYGDILEKYLDQLSTKRFDQIPIPPIDFNVVNMLD